MGNGRTNVRTACVIIVINLQWAVVRPSGSIKLNRVAMKLIRELTTFHLKSWCVTGISWYVSNKSEQIRVLLSLFCESWCQFSSLLSDTSIQIHVRPRIIDPLVRSSSDQYIHSCCASTSVSMYVRSCKIRVSTIKNQFQQNKILKMTVDWPSGSLMTPPIL